MIEHELTSGARRICSRSLSSCRMNPAAEARPSIMPACSASLPSTLTKTARALEVGRDAHFSDGSQPGEARILQLARKHGADFVPDFAGNTFVPMSCIPSWP